MKKSLIALLALTPLAFAEDVRHSILANPQSPYYVDFAHYPKADPGLPVGVFDSGTGGLTVLNAIVAYDEHNNASGAEGSDGQPDFAHEDMIYLADQANLPYGNYPGVGKTDLLLEHILKCAQFLLGSNYYGDAARGDKKPVKVMVIACSDSRVDPAQIFDVYPGEIFVVRNVAALVPPPDIDGRPHGTAAAIEFGVVALGVQHVVVLGHSFCAGVRCLLEHDHGSRRFDYVSDWMAVARDVQQEMQGLVTEAEQMLVARRAEQAAVLTSLRHLAAYPFVADRVARGQLALHGWYFHFGWGVLQAAAGPAGPFRQVDDAAPAPAIGRLPLPQAA